MGLMLRFHFAPSPRRYSLSYLQHDLQPAPPNSRQFSATTRAPAAAENAFCPAARSTSRSTTRR
jgi:hypothetical protein